MYRIEVVFQPHDEAFPWRALIHTVTPDEYKTVRIGTTHEEALESAQEWIKAENSAEPPGATYTADENGNLL